MGGGRWRRGAAAGHCVGRQLWDGWNMGMAICDAAVVLMRVAESVARRAGGDVGRGLCAVGSGLRRAARVVAWVDVTVAEATWGRSWLGWLAVEGWDGASSRWERRRCGPAWTWRWRPGGRWVRRRRGPARGVMEWAPGCVVGRRTRGGGCVPKVERPLECGLGSRRWGRQSLRERAPGSPSLALLGWRVLAAVGVARGGRERYSEQVALWRRRNACWPEGGRGEALPAGAGSQSRENEPRREEQGEVVGPGGLFPEPWGRRPEGAFGPGRWHEE